jgi:hypothetical protein
MHSGVPPRHRSIGPLVFPRVGFVWTASYFLRLRLGHRLLSDVKMGGCAAIWWLATQIAPHKALYPLGLRRCRNDEVVLGAPSRGLWLFWAAFCVIRHLFSHLEFVMFDI